MGKQVRFYMAYEDEIEFITAARERAPVKLIYNTFFDKSEMEIKSLVPVGANIYDSFLSLVNGEIDSHVSYRDRQQQSPFCVDLWKSEVVEFSRCHPVNSRIVDGRLWFEERYDMKKKSVEFIRWANSLLAWIRRHYSKQPNGSYFAPRAMELSMDGKIPFTYDVRNPQ